MLEALILFPHLITIRYSFFESLTKSHWHHVNGFLIRLHATLSSRDAASKSGGSITDIYILTEKMNYDKNPLRLSDISRVLVFFVSLFSLYFLSSLVIYKLARLENHRVYIEALSPSQVRRSKKEYIG